ncbi:MAG: serine hydrolase, partial [Actinobacteria bacterium]|nr:serine hydrolase [Actinomycetota bacterium]
MRCAPRSLAGRCLYSQFSRLPQLYAPGCGWSYSLASDVLGWVISEASMLPLSGVLRREVFDPLGMTCTCLFSELQKNHDVAIVYEHRQHGWQPATSTMVNWADAGAPESGGSSMVTTLRDMMRLASAYVEASQDFLSADLWNLT